MKISQFQELLFTKENQIRELQENNKRLKDESKLYKQEKSGEGGVFAGLSFVEQEKQNNSANKFKQGEEQPESGATDAQNDEDDE